MNEIRVEPAKHYVLIADIDLGEDDLTTEWDPIPSFSGSLDGGNHSIFNLNIPGSDSDVGLFKIVSASAVIKDLKIHANEVRGADRVGILVGTNKGSMENVSVAGAVYGDDRVGGLIGFNDPPNSNSKTISNSSSDIYVSGENDVGGLVAQFIYGSISKSSATGKVTGGGDFVGGLIGESSKVIISESSATGNNQFGSSMFGL